MKIIIIAILFFLPSCSSTYSEPTINQDVIIYERGVDQFLLEIDSVTKEFNLTNIPNTDVEKLYSHRPMFIWYQRNNETLFVIGNTKGATIFSYMVFKQFFKSDEEYSLFLEKLNVVLTQYKK